MPFYQPLAALEMFSRALQGTDLATGLVPIVDPSNATYAYKTVGTPKSTFREGNATVQFEVTPKNATYNTKLNAPDPVPTWSASAAQLAKRDSSEKEQAVNMKRRRRQSRFPGQRMGKPRRFG